MAEETDVKWAEPHEVNAVTRAFPANIGHLMPTMEEIPEDFRKRTEASVEWFYFQTTWFYRGLGKDSGFIGVHLREGIDGDRAFDHLGAIQGSFEPKHEHKMAAVAWLASCWFEKVEWKKGHGHQS